MVYKMQEYLERYIETPVIEDLKRKMVFIGGPRQSGKTTLAKHLCDQAGHSTEERYLNWDAAEDREQILLERFPTAPGLLILDEIHKYTRWRQMVKGLYDKRGHEVSVLVTGSARLDHFRRGGDSLQGRYHFYRLMPLSLAELNAPKASTIDALLAYGGFPEPFSLQSETQTRRWSRDYRTRVIGGDLLDLENIQDVGIIERMALRLPELVGSPLSLNALREDLQVAHQSVSRWLTMLENLYMVFRLYPFGAPHIRAVKKEAKHYHMDWCVVPEPGPKFENLTACHLLKWCFFIQDTQGREVELRYFRDVDRREVDFVVTENRNPMLLVECKQSEKSVSGSLRYLKIRFPQATAVQLYHGNGQDRTDRDGIRICPAHTFFSELV
jgi:predicted AAA+ superfamily ATPase